MRVEQNTINEALSRQTVQNAGAAVREASAASEVPIIPTGSLFDAVGVKLDLTSEARQYLEKGRSVNVQVQAQPAGNGTIQNTPVPAPAAVSDAWKAPAQPAPQIDLVA